MEETSQLMRSLLAGDRRSLAKVITLIESSNTESDVRDYVIETIFSQKINSKFIGFSGPPGVGKSTVIQTFGKHLLGHGHKVAVLAVDPSSPVGGGSILGDKTRMAEIAADENVFVRPSPSMGYLGGLTSQTYLSQLLCAIAGYKYVLIETVGVGQSEVEASRIVDLFVALSLPNSGDALQGIKKGILEIADIIAINKADGDLLSAAERARSELENAFQLSRGVSSREKVFLTISAVKNKGIDKLHDVIEDIFAKNSGELEMRFQKILKQDLRYQDFIHAQYIDLVRKKISIQRFVDDFTSRVLS